MYAFLYVLRVKILWSLSACEEEGDAVVVTASADGRWRRRHAWAADGAWRRESAAPPRQYHQAQAGARPTGGGGGERRRQAGVADGTLWGEPVAQPRKHPVPVTRPAAGTVAQIISGSPCALVRS
jgi:hypothetical protein